MARSVWRLIENPTSLLAQVLKAKYYTNSDVLNSSCLGKASWVWKCLHTTINKIKPFISWVVGEGNFIDPWCDNWIPGKGVATPKANSIPNKNLKVSDLINHDTRTWDIAKLSVVSDQSSKEMIEKIPLSSDSSIDRRIWTPSKDGVFTTKSAYSVISVRGDDSNSDLWKEIWRLKAPARIQFFVWKALKGALPVNEILYDKIHISEDICPKCKLKSESIMHALVTCKKLTNVWQLKNIQSDQFQDFTFIQWVKFWLQLNPYKDQSSRLEKFHLIAAVTWSIWTNRNGIVHGDNQEEPITIISRVKSMMLDIPKIPFINRISAINQNQSIPTYWMSPPRNWLKINTYGAWNPNTEIGGMGFLIRDSSHQFIYAESKNLVCFSTEEAEIYGIREALRAAKKLKMDRIIIEGDAAEVIEKIKGENFLGDQRTHYLYQDIRALIPSFQSILFNLSNRTCNGAAHELAQWGKKNVTQMAWFMPPGWLIPALCGDFRREPPSVQ